MRKAKCFQGSMALVQDQVNNFVVGKNIIDIQVTGCSWTSYSNEIPGVFCTIIYTDPKERKKP